ncbi:MAG: hypothetical protein LBI69_05270 [Puniceicoccales bacterium]|nr:hypothetical protein [Puniceicoccales bacterium]
MSGLFIDSNTVDQPSIERRTSDRISDAKLLLKTYVPLAIIGLLSTAAIVLSAFCFLVNCAAAIALLAFAIALPCGGMFYMKQKQNKQDTQEFMKKMKVLFGPYIRKYESVSGEFISGASPEQKAQHLKQFDPPFEGLFYLSDDYDMELLFNQFRHLVRCFMHVTNCELENNQNEYNEFLKKFIVEINHLPKKEIETLLKIPYNSKNCTLIHTMREKYNSKHSNWKNARYSNFVRAIVNYGNPTLIKCYLKALMEVRTHDHFTLFSRLLYYENNIDLLSRILSLYEKNDVQLENLIGFQHGNTILSVATQKSPCGTGESSDKMCAIMWEFLSEVLSKQDLKKLCLTHESGGNFAIQNFLLSQKNNKLKIQCLQFLKDNFIGDEMRTFFGNDTMLSMMYNSIDVEDEDMKIMDAIDEMFGKNVIGDYLRNERHLCIQGNWQEKAEKFRHILRNRYGNNLKITIFIQK